MGKTVTDGMLVSVASKFLRAVRGYGLSKGESPIDAAIFQLQCDRPKSSDESKRQYLLRHIETMKAYTRASGVRRPKKTKKAKADFLQSFEWRKVRMQALLKYGAKCMACGATPKTGAVMNVDHIKPRLTHPELALDLDNLQVLCSDCNHGKGNWDCTDWRNK